MSVQRARKVAGNWTERRWIRFFGIAISQVEITQVGGKQICGPWRLKLRTATFAKELKTVNK